jgi:monofunctional glycosyltransferase
MGNRRRAESRKGFGRRLLKWTGILALSFVLLTVAPVSALRWLDPPTSAFMLRAAYDARQNEAYRTRHEWMDFERISPHAAVAVIAAEDQLFARHAGFDFKSIREAAERNGRSKRIRGASTITQQVAKNLFLWSGRSYVRKGLEAWFTALIEFLWPKQRILEVYLNIAEFGHGIYGVESASRRFYRHSAARLTRSEAATLAAVLPNPRRLRADKPSRYVVSRRDWILVQMRMLGGRSYLAQLEPSN